MSLKRTSAALTLILCSAIAGHAQMAGMATAAPGTIIDPVKSLTPAVDGLQALITGAAKAMPPEKYSFAPSAAIFVTTQPVKYDGVRTYAQLMTHIIQANYRYFGFIGAIKPDVDVAAIGKLTSKDDILKALDATFAFAHKAVANVTAANAFETVPGRPGSNATRVTAFAGAIAHAEDEYGQAVEYLRMNGIIPPASAPRE
jgi:hypothetical protein